MKKSIFSIAALLSVFLIFGCANSSDSSGTSPSGEDIPISEQTFDFRIKTNTVQQSVARSARAADNEKHYVLTEPFIDPDSGKYVIFKNELNLSESDVISLFKLEANHTDALKGIKITFNKTQIQGLKDLEEQGYTYHMFMVTYMDGNRNYTSRMNYYTWRDENETKKTVFYYPLVQPNSDATGLSIAIIYKKPNSEDTCEVSSLYIIDTISGFGTIDDLPSGYNEDVSHVVIDGLTATVTKVIPPDDMGGIAKNMRNGQCLFYTDATEDSKRYDAPHNGFGNKYETINDNDSFNLDLSISFNPYPETVRKNMFIQQVYCFTIDGYEDVEFFTPELISPLVPFDSVEYDLNQLGYWAHWGDDKDDGTQYTDLTSDFQSDANGINFTIGDGKVYVNGSGVMFKISNATTVENKGKTKVGKRFYATEGKTYKITFKKSDGVEPNGFWGKELGWKGIGNGEDQLPVTVNTDGSFSVNFVPAASEEINMSFRMEEAGTYSITDFTLEEVTE